MSAIVRSSSPSRAAARARPASGPATSRRSTSQSMPAIARNLVILAAAAAVLGLADTHSDIVDLFASMTAALADDNPAGFMAAFDKDMPDYDKLQDYIAG